MWNASRMGRTVFGALVAGSLSLGAAQALATPGAVARDETTCDRKQCHFFCVSIGYDSGQCTGPFGTGDCECIIWSE